MDRSAEKPCKMWSETHKMFTGCFKINTVKYGKNMLFYFNDMLQNTAGGEE